MSEVSSPPAASTVSDADDPFKKYWWAILMGIAFTAIWLLTPMLGEKSVGSTVVDTTPKAEATVEQSFGADAGDGINLSMEGTGRARKEDPLFGSALYQPPPEAAPDPAAAAAARSEAAARAAAGGAINSGGGAGAVGSMRGPANAKKLGALSGATSGGASTTAGSGTVGRLGDNLAAASRNSQTSGFSRGGPGAKASGAKGRAARGGRGARMQARNVMGDHLGGRAGSSFAAGRTYDGSSTNSGGAIGPDGGAIGMGGVGDGAAGEQPRSLPANKLGDPNELTPKPPKPNPIVTPWEKALKSAMMAVALAGALLFAANMLLGDVTIFGKAATLIIAKTLVWMAAAAAAVALYYAAQATFGDGGQKLQGGLIMAAATLVGGLAVYMGFQTFSNPVAGKKAAVMSNPLSPGLIKLIGGAAAVAVIGSMMTPKKSMPESEARAKGYPTSYYTPAPQQNYRV